MEHQLPKPAVTLAKIRAVGKVFSQHLAGGTARKLIDQQELPRDFKGSQFFLAGRTQVLGRDSWFWHDVGPNEFAVVRTGHADHCTIHNQTAAKKGVLNLERVDLEGSDINERKFSSRDIKITVFIEATYVAGKKPG